MRRRVAKTPAVGDRSVPDQIDGEAPSSSASTAPDGPLLAGQSSGAVSSVARVIEIDPQADPRWRVYVTSHPDGLVYHHPAWLQVLRETYGHESLGLAAEGADGQLQGVLPLFHTHGLVTGRSLASLPHTPTAGPLADGDRPTAALVREAVARVRELPRSRLRLKGFALGLDTLVDDLAAMPWNSTYVLELPADSGDLRFGNSRNHARVKWAVNKAAKMGVTVRPAETRADLRAWYELYLETMRWHAVPPRPYRLFELAWEVLEPQGLLRLLLAERSEGGRTSLLAGSVFLMSGRTVHYAFNGRRQEALSFRPNYPLQWQAIHDACREGFRHYDLGEVEENQQGLAAFKATWGAEQRRLYRYYYPAPREAELGLLKPGSHARRLAEGAWRRLPLKATEVLGAWVYRYL